MKHAIGVWIGATLIMMFLGGGAKMPARDWFVGCTFVGGIVALAYWCLAT